MSAEATLATEGTSSETTVEEISPGQVVQRRGDCSAFVRWSLSNFTRLTAQLRKREQTAWIAVGNHDCRLLLYPGGKA